MKKSKQQKYEEAVRRNIRLHRNIGTRVTGKQLWMFKQQLGIKDRDPFFDKELEEFVKYRKLWKLKSQ